MNQNVSLREQTACAIIVDHTHMGRRASGIERVTRELFSAEALAPLASRATPAPSGRLAMIFNQMIANPLRAAMNWRDVWLFPGYPPSPIFLFLPCVKVLYVHDLFLKTRWGDLNWPAKLYMALPFALAVERYRYFFVNSLTTGRQLAAVAPSGARILPFRPPAHNVLGLKPSAAAKAPGDPIVIGALGTVEPRKNFIASAEIVRALSEKLDRRVELHIVGRPGWGKDCERLRSMPHVRLHGFVPDALMPKLVAGWDAFLCSSHDEGLGLPLLEMQHAGLPIIAPDQEIFHEVLGASGAYVQPDRPHEAAAVIADLLGAPHWRGRSAELARQNLARWNQLAEEDRTNAIALLSRLCGGSGFAHSAGEDPGPAGGSRQ
jgi:glycosyltransferase involved in cell wall biosynthesis